MVDAMGGEVWVRVGAWVGAMVGAGLEREVEADAVAEFGVERLLKAEEELGFEVEVEVKVG